MTMATATRKRLLLVAATAGYQTKIFADVARLLGVEVSLATDRCHVLNDPWGDLRLFRKLPVHPAPTELSPMSNTLGYFHVMAEPVSTWVQELVAQYAE